MAQKEHKQMSDVKIEFRGPFQCGKCGREIPEDRDCPRCESFVPDWIVLAMIGITGFALVSACYFGYRYSCVIQQMKEMAAQEEVWKRGEVKAYRPAGSSAPLTGPDVIPGGSMYCDSDSMRAMVLIAGKWTDVGSCALSSSPTPVAKPKPSTFHGNYYGSEPTKRNGLIGKDDAAWVPSITESSDGKPIPIGVAVVDLPVCMGGSSFHVGYMCRSLDGAKWEMYTKDGWKTYEVQKP